MEAEPSSPVPPRPRRINWAALVLGVLLVGSLVTNAFLGTLALAAVGSRPAAGGASFEEILVDGEPSAEEKVVVLPIRGVIMEGSGMAGRSAHMVSEVREALRHLRRDKAVRALVLDIDSPGGGVTASDQIYHELKAFREETGVPIVALLGDVAASGGYYVAVASDHIVAHTTTLTGSIGVITHLLVWKELMDTVGIEVETIKSVGPNGRSYKDMGSPFRSMTPEERALMEGIIHHLWERFVSVVAEGRQGKLTPEEVRMLADGRIFTGPEALKLKLVDSLGYRGDAFRRARELGHAEGARVVRLRRLPRLLEILSGLGASARPLDMMEGVERAARRSPRFMYLWVGR